MELEKLNDMQLKAVNQLTGPVLILAGAGSGKTKTVINRIANLINSGVSPNNILGITFTRKAADEMKERAIKILGEDFRESLTLNTFHSVCASILREDGSNIGINQNFNILEGWDQIKVMGEVIDRLKLRDNFPKPTDLIKHVSSAKNSMIKPPEFMNDYPVFNRDLTKKSQISKIYSEYQKKNKVLNNLDFEDLLLYTYDLFKTRPEILSKYQNLYQYIMVDEYQDTNIAQFELLKLLYKKYENVCIVGDDDQSIYGFRGANIDNIFNFQKEVQDITTIKLEENYRSTKYIVEASNSVIKNNRKRNKKTLYTNNIQGEKVHVHESVYEKDEVEFVINDIKNRLDSTTPNYNDFCILYRNNALSLRFEEELKRNNIPFSMKNSTDFYDRAEIKDVMSYFKILTDPSDDEAAERLILLERGVGKETINKLVNCSKKHNISLMSALWFNTQNDPQYECNIQSYIKERLKRIPSDFSYLKNIYETNGFQGLLDTIMLESNYVNSIREKIDESATYQEKYENIKELENRIQTFINENNNPTISGFLQDIKLLNGERLNSNNGINLMTIHSAKGLEFKYVYIVCLEDSILPSQYAYSQQEIEEERRVMYVGMTRAQELLTLSYYLLKVGKFNFTEVTPSKFINEIPQNLKKVV